MNAAGPAVLGAMLGAGVLLVVMGLRTLLNQKLEDKSRKRGFWPLNAGVLLAVVSMYMMTMAP